MIYTLKEIDEKLKNTKIQLSEKFIGICGCVLEEESQYYIADAEGRKLRLAPYKINHDNIHRLTHRKFFFGFVNEARGEGAVHLKKEKHPEGLENVVFVPLLDGLGGFLKDQKSKNKHQDVKATLCSRLKKGAVLQVTVICPKNGRVYRDLISGIKFKRKESYVDKRYKLTQKSTEFYQTSDEDKTEDLLNNFIKTLDDVDRKEHDLVIVVRGGGDLDIPNIFDDAYSFAAIATMKNLTACAIGHTNEHAEFSQYCDYHEETPSLLGVTLGDWVEEALNTGVRHGFKD